MNSNAERGSAAEAPTVLSIDVAANDAGVTGAAGWPLWQRAGFRFLFVYYVLYAFPKPISSLLQTVVGLVGWVDGEWQTTLGDAAPIRWFSHWLKELGKVEAPGWQSVTSWLSERGWTPYEVIHQPTGSGDTGHAIAQLLVIGIAALVVAAAWSALRRGPAGYPRLGRWLHLFVRFDLAFTLVGSGFAKFYVGQFGELELMRLTQEIGDTTPMGMVGTFMQASRPYELFGGGCEVLAGLLLFHRRTALLGAVAAFATLANVCALNWLYGVPVKLDSTHQLLAAVLLLAPFAQRLWAVFVTNQPSAPVDLAVVTWRWARWLLFWIGTLWVLASLWLTHVGGLQAASERAKAGARSPLYGLWLVDRMLFDGVELPRTDALRWRSVAIDSGNFALAREATGQIRPFDFVWDAATGIAQVKVLGTAAEVLAEPWTVERGTKVVKVDVPLLLTREDYNRAVDGERRTLVLKGKLDGKQLEVHTIEKMFRLQTGFRLRQELPDGW